MTEFKVELPDVRDTFRDDKFALTDKGLVKSSTGNVIAALMNPIYARQDGIIDGQFFYDSFRNEMKYKGRLCGENLSSETVRRIDDNLINKIGIEIERHYEIGFSGQRTLDAIRYVTNECTINTAAQHLDHLKWNGDEDAIKKLLPTYLGAEDTSLNAWIMEHMIVGMVKRIVEPGSKFDEMMVLVGAQGIGKSTFSRYLSLNDDWFCSIGDIKNKDVVINMMGKAVVEVEEFVALRKIKSAGEAKAFISKSVDTIRVPYDKFSSDVKRTSILVGTLNEMEFLNDHTGERRYLPVKCDIKKRKKPIYPLPEFLCGLTNSQYEESVRADFENAVAYGYKLYKEDQHQMTLPFDLADMLEDVQEKCKYEDPDVTDIEDFLYAHKPSTDDPYRCCWKEYSLLGYKLDHIEFGLIMVNYFPEWVKHSSTKTEHLYPNGRGERNRIATKCYYELKRTDETKEELTEDLSEQKKEMDTEGFVQMEIPDIVSQKKS